MKNLIQPPLRVAAYCRVSTDHEDQLNSLVNQRNYFSAYIADKKNWSLAAIFYDEGISGTQTRKRDGFNAMITAAQRGEIDLILTKEVSRFARNTVDTLSYTRHLKSLGVGVLFLLDHIDTRDCDGELRLTLMASIAQEESRKTSERVKWGQTRRMEQGIVFGRDLLGYSVQDGKLTIIPEEAAIVRSIYHKYAIEGKSTIRIANELNAAGIPTKRGVLWSSSVIYRLLRNEKYVGDLCQKKTVTPDYLTHKKRPNPLPDSMIYLPDHHEAIIDRSVWTLAQEQLRQRSRSGSSHTRYSTRYWCSGKIICGICNSHYVSFTKRRKDQTRYHAFRCSHTTCKNTEQSGANNSLSMRCGNNSINEETLCECVRYILREFHPPVVNSADFKELVETIYVYPGHIVSVKIKNVPHVYQLTYHTKGRLDQYSTTISECKCLKRIK